MDLKNKLIKNILILIALIAFSVNLCAEKEKFQSTFPFMFESPVRYIIIVDPCEGGTVEGCSNAAIYYEINKKTGNFLKLKGNYRTNVVTHKLYRL